jgi:hypothetical protein
VPQCCTMSPAQLDRAALLSLLEASMPNDEHRTSHVEVDDDGSVVAFADVEYRGGAEAARATLHVEGGHRPPDTGARLVDAVMETSEVQEAGAVVAAVPKGEGAAIEHAHERLSAATARVAGSTVLVEGEVPRQNPGPQERSDHGD